MYVEEIITTLNRPVKGFYEDFTKNLFAEEEMIGERRA